MADNLTTGRETPTGTDKGNGNAPPPANKLWTPHKFILSSYRLGEDNFSSGQHSSTDSRMFPFANNNNSIYPENTENVDNSPISNNESNSPPPYPTMNGYSLDYSQVKIEDDLMYQNYVVENRTFNEGVSPNLLFLVVI